MVVVPLIKLQLGIDRYEILELFKNFLYARSVGGLWKSNLQKNK